MWWLLLPLTALAEDKVQHQKQPDINHHVYTQAERAKFRPPYKQVTMDEIVASGIEYGYVKPGRTLIRLSDNEPVNLTEELYAKFFRQSDEQGYKYIQSNDGKVQYKVSSASFVSVSKELELYEPPLKYTPAPLNIVKTEYDTRLKVVPEVAFYIGSVQGAFMRDLFNDKKAETGVTNQYGLHFATRWKLPIKVGLVAHYERASYELVDGGNVYYTSPSFGPQFKTQEFDILGNPLRLQTQFRVSPFARAQAETVRGNVTFKFNSADLLFSAEHPISNRFGEFVLGLYVQQQWLSIKDQPEIVSVNATNAINRSFGVSFSQVFQ